MSRTRTLLKAILTFLGLGLILLPPVLSLAEYEETTDALIEDGVNEWLDQISLDEWQQTVRSLPEEVRALWADVDIAAFVTEYSLSGGKEEVFSGEALKRLFFGELRDASGMLSLFIGLAVLSGLLRAMTEDGKGADAAGFVLRCFVLSLLLLRLMSGVTVGVNCMDAMRRFLEVALPALLTLLTALGGTASAGILQPAMTLLTGVVTRLMTDVVLPLALAGGVLGMLDQLTGRARIGEIATLAKKSAKWLIGIVSVLYLGTTSLRGMAAAAYDGVTLRTAKYAASSLLPIVGGMVSGTMDTMLGCAALVKNAAGLAAMMLLVGIAVLPLLRILAVMLLLRLSAALSQPIADEKLPKLFSEAADMLSYLFAATAAVVMMFLLTVALAAGIGNIGFVG